MKAIAAGYDAIFSTGIAAILSRLTVSVVTMVQKWEPARHKTPFT